MSTYSSGTISGPGGSVAWRLTGPAALHQAPALTHSQWEAVAAPGVRLLANVIRGEAQQAYAGTRFAGAFGYRTTLRPTVGLTLFNRLSPLFDWVERTGTKRHKIAARNAPYLVFKVGGHWVRIKSVNHPGTRPKHLIDRIFARYDSTFRRIVTDAMREVLTRG